MTTKPDFYTGWTEPESAANTSFRPVYPYNNATVTPSGHSFELDDTPSRERIRLNHRSGTFIEMHPNGNEVHKVYGDGYEITIKDKYMHIQGRLKIDVDGDCELHVVGDLIKQIDGNVEEHVKGNYSRTVEGLTSIVSQGDYRVFAGDGTPLNGISLNGNVKMQSDLNIDGEIVATKITSKTRVDAGTGMSAGILGFVTELGGISVGIPVAVPETINCAGPINSLTSVTAPAGLWITSDSILSFDVVNLLFHNIHTHPITRGFSGPPVPPEIA
jgi:hypothetical protein